MKEDKKIKHLIIEKQQANQRLNKFLGRYLNTAPQSFVYKMLRKKNITLNSKKAHGSEILVAGDKITLFLSDETIKKFSEKQQSPIPNAKPNIDIIYEDENILIATKPKGRLSHPDKANKQCFIYDILAYLQAKGELNSDMFTPALANRLDRNTTGLVLCGKNLPAMQALNSGIKNRDITKYYAAIVMGELKKQGTLIGYHTKDTKKNTAYIAQKPTSDCTEQVITKYEPIKTYRSATHVKLQLVTGKTHQLRAHMQSIGHPILGDTKYGYKPKKEFDLKSQLLHAHQLCFNNNIMGLEYLKGKTFTAPLPKEFENILFLLEEMKEMEEMK